MKERPILFSAPMVRALLAGTKTQTRRVVKPQPIPATTVVGTYHHPDDDDGRGPRYWSGGPDPSNPGYSYIQPDWAIPCPYGQTGDRLWVREAWRHIEGGVVYDAAGGVADAFEPETVYRADRPTRSGRWKPSIHMPRWASRITLEVTGVRVERLHDISTSDCWAEGIPSSPDVDPIHEYQELWESINGIGSWDANPWVWVVEFKRAEGGAA